MANGDLAATDAALDAFYAGVEAEATSGNLTLDEAIDLMRLSGTMDTTLARGTAPGPAEAALDAALTPLFRSLGEAVNGGEIMSQ
jgi:hypothetical protein